MCGDDAWDPLSEFQPHDTVSLAIVTMPYITPQTLLPAHQKGGAFDLRLPVPQGPGSRRPAPFRDKCFLRFHPEVIPQVSVVLRPAHFA